MAESFHSNKKNQLEDERLKNLFFVHYNLQLQHRQTASSGSKFLIRGAYDPICLEGMDANTGDWLEDPGVLEGGDVSWMDATLSSDGTVASNGARTVDDDDIDDRSSDNTEEEDSDVDS
ncbi:hypothetical protein ACLOJK_040670 [Asimina triloba]